MAFDPGGGPLLNMLDFADALGVTRWTVRNWLNAGTCPVAPVESMKPPKWRRVDVAAFLAPAPAGDA
jgi:predicted site-specific integrase-resolvase